MAVVPKTRATIPSKFSRIAISVHRRTRARPSKMPYRTESMRRAVKVLKRLNAKEQIMAHPYVEYSNWEYLAADPLVSIMMLAYDHEPYLRDAIEGVIAQQTNFPIELIIGEDASSDSSRAIALEYWRAHPHLIRVITADRNVGMHENHARILKAARGRYMAFCEGDDCWHRPDKLRIQVELLESDPNISLVCSSWRTISEQGTVLIPDELGLQKGRVYQFGLDEILSGQVKTVTVCTRTELAQRALQESPLCKIGLYPFGDSPLWVAVTRRGHCLCLPEDYGTYRLSKNSATRPREIMDVYRFIAGAADFDRTVLGLYPLREGSKATTEARIAATRKRLRALALLGDAENAREEVCWLYRLGAKIRLRDYLSYWVAILSQTGTWSAGVRKWGLLKWHALTHDIRRLPPHSISSSIPRGSQPIASPARAMRP